MYVDNFIGLKSQQLAVYYILSMSQYSFSTQHSYNRPRDPRIGKIGKERVKQQQSRPQSPPEISKPAPPEPPKAKVHFQRPHELSYPSINSPYQRGEVSTPFHEYGTPRTTFNSNRNRKHFPPGQPPFPHHQPPFQPANFHHSPQIRAPYQQPPFKQQHFKIPPPISQRRPFPEQHRPERPKETVRHNQIPRPERKNDLQDKDDYSSVSSGSGSEEEQEIYHKRRPIHKRKDPVLDSNQEIRKWIEARKRNYPRANATDNLEKKQRSANQQELSILEKKIRKKLLIINADGRGIAKKMKDIDILRKFILNPRRKRKRVDFRPNEGASYREKPQMTYSETISRTEPNRQVSRTTEDRLKDIEVDSESGEAKQEPIRSQDPPKIETPVKPTPQAPPQREQLTVGVIIQHLQMRRAEDSKTMQTLMDYKSNSNSYRYQYQTLETNLALNNIFNESTRFLQAIRYIVKNNFFDEPQQEGMKGKE